MSRFYHLILISSLAIFISSCCHPHTKDYYFTEDDKKWALDFTIPYLVFMDSSHISDTFMVKPYGGYYLYDPHAGEDHPSACTWDRNEHFHFFANSQNHELGFEIIKGKDLSFQFYLDQCSSVANSSQGFSLQNIGPMQIQDSLYPEIYLIPALNCQQNTLTTIKSAYFVKGLGYVRFNTNEGKTYDLVRE